MSGVPLKGGVTVGGDGDSASSEHEKRTARHATVSSSDAFLNEFEIWSVIILIT